MSKPKVTNRFNGKCRGCNKPISVFVNARRPMAKNVLEDPYAQTEDYRRLAAYLIKCERRPTSYLTDRYVFETDKGLFTQISGYDGTLNVMCPHGCEKWVLLKPVFGVFNKDIKCNSRCQGSTRHVCECSCGGRNHGAGS